MFTPWFYWPETVAVAWGEQTATGCNLATLFASVDEQRVFLGGNYAKERDDEGARPL